MKIIFTAETARSQRLRILKTFTARFAQERKDREEKRRHATADEIHSHRQVAKEDAKNSSQKSEVRRLKAEMNARTGGAEENSN